MSILKHIVWLIVTAFISSSCATYSRNEAECNLAKTEDNPVWDAEKLDEAFKFACKLGSNNLIVATNGDVVKSMGELNKPLRLHSARKALLSAIVGQHVGTGPNQINLESTLAELGINDKPNPLTPLWPEVPCFFELVKRCWDTSELSFHWPYFLLQGEVLLPVILVRWLLFFMTLRILYTRSSWCV